jgi:orotate phosphoribosyltransferase
VTSKKRVVEILNKSGALLEGHFRYTSGRHGAVYIEKIRIVQHPDLVYELSGLIADAFSDVADEIDLVCAPAFGAIVFGFATAQILDKPFVFLQRNSEGKMILRSGFDLSDKTNILLIEDIVTTGGSVLEAVSALKECGASVRHIGLIVDRTNGKIDFGIPHRSLLCVDVKSWTQEECPLCKKGIPLRMPGSSGKKR